MQQQPQETRQIVLKEAYFTAMGVKSKMFFYKKTDEIIRAELLTIFPTAILHSITDYSAILTRSETRKYDKEFKIKTKNAKQHLTNKKQP